MNLLGIAQAIGFLLWMLTLGIAWYMVGQKRSLPIALLLPGFLATLPLAFILRGALGEASLTLPVLAAYVAGGAKLPAPPKTRALFGGLIVASILINASGLGIIDYDIYGLGYFPGWTLLFITVATVYAHFRAPAVAWAWLIGLGLFAVGLHPSPNMWDALIDVPATFLALYLLLKSRSNQFSG